MHGRIDVAEVHAARVHRRVSPIRAKRRESRRVQSGSDARGGDDASRRFAAERAGKAEAEAAVGVVEGNRVREVVVEGG